jgi:glycosyltransferase involved in cell wall biosynthesis
MEKSQYKISVIIPTYNREKLILNAIESLKKQTYQDFEIIVVDDCSSDNTQALLENDDRVKYVRHSENKGASEARNTGIGLSEAEFIAFLDSDDEWLPLKLEKQIEVFNKNKNVGVVYTGVQNILRGHKISENSPKYRGDIKRELMKANIVGTTSTVMVKADLLKKVDGFDTNLLSCQDWDLWVRLAQITEFDFVEDPLVFFHQHEGERISSNVTSVVIGHVDFYNKHIDLIKTLNRKDNSYLHYSIARKIIISGIVDKNRSTLKKGRTLLRNSIMPFPNSFKCLLLYYLTFLNEKTLYNLYFMAKKNKTSYRAN